MIHILHQHHRGRQSVRRLEHLLRKAPAQAQCGAACEHQGRWSWGGARCDGCHTQRRAASCQPAFKQARTLVTHPRATPPTPTALPPLLTICTMMAACLPGNFPAVVPGLRSNRVAPAWCAAAMLSIVLPAPAGPYSSTVCGAFSLQHQLFLSASPPACQSSCWARTSLAAVATHLERAG